MRLEVQAAALALDGWVFLERLNEAHGFVMSWIRQVMTEGSEQLSLLVDQLDELQITEVLVRFEHPMLPPGGVERFAHYDAERGLALFGISLEAEDASELRGEPWDDHEVAHRPSEYGFIAVRTVDSKAFLVLPEAEDHTWWPDNYRQEEGYALPVDTCRRILDVAFQ